MTARHWRGFTKPEHASAYEHLLRETVLPSLDRLAGYRGGYILRRDVGGEVEFVVINFFESIEAVRAFAGPDPEIAVLEPEALELLARFDTRAAHYEVRHRSGTSAADVQSAIS